MLKLSESTMENLQSVAVRDGIEQIAHTLLECFPDRIPDIKSALYYTENAYRNMKKFPIEDEELPRWTFLSVIIGNEKFHEAPEMKKYLSMKGREKVRLLFNTVQDCVSN